MLEAFKPSGCSSKAVVLHSCSAPLSNNLVESCSLKIEFKTDPRRAVACARGAPYQEGRGDPLLNGQDDALLGCDAQGCGSQLEEAHVKHGRNRFENACVAPQRTAVQEDGSAALNWERRTRALCTELSEKDAQELSGAPRTTTSAT